MDTLAELEALERALASARVHGEVRQWRAAGDGDWPVYALLLGNPSPDAPGVGVFGGVHGLERIGAQVVIAWLDGLVQRLRWDTTLHTQLERVRLVVMPLVNPGGMARHTRANPAGVDLMRNGPIDALEPVAPLVGGQRLSAGLPWYRGRAAEPMQPESAALCQLVEDELHGRPLALALDCHSGFGLRDRLWFPYAHSRRPIAHLPELHALCTIFDGSLAQHPYVIEPQSHQYLAHGDLWDHLTLRALEGPGVFLPLTLEMGSWMWVKKNPRQLLSRAGMFNPQAAHRHDRVLRRHVPLLDFLLRAAVASTNWMPEGEARDAHRRAALARWYHGRP